MGYSITAVQQEGWGFIWPPAMGSLEERLATEGRIYTRKV
jgi:hypothetical protein